MSSNSRVALAAGVSALAIVLSAPAFAAGGETPGVGETLTAANVQSTLVISNVGDDLVFGDDRSGVGNVSVDIASVGTGAVSQIATATGTSAPDGNALITLANSGSARSLAGAAAISSESATTAVAQAQIGTGIGQNATGNFAASANLTNSGTLGIDARASAEATYSASAYALIDSGINQQVTGQDAAAVTDNSGTFQIGSVASAVSTSGNADASAEIYGGSYQMARGERATSAIDNSGTFDISSVAAAEASDFASAYAEAHSNVSQIAHGSALASVSLVNSADDVLAIGAQATANGASARADARADSAIYQYATAANAGGSVSAAITNVGSISIAANAAATAAGSSASADAYAGGIYQSTQGYGADASVSLANTGTLAVSALASGTAAGTMVYDAIWQRAYVDGDADAAVDIANAGDLGISLSSNALAADYASASAMTYDLVSQSAEAGGVGNAKATFANSAAGALGVDLTADAKTEDEGADARAIAGWVLNQSAFSGEGDAETSISNQGAIAFAINAAALSGTGQAYSTAGQRSNVALRDSAGGAGAISQAATVNGSGTARAAFDNSGSIDANAAAVSTGSEAVAQANFDGIYQSARAGSSSSALNGDAAVVLTNTSSGKISLKADATATGTGDYAWAQSALGSGLTQAASADAGNAGVDLSNAGFLTMAATANADVAEGEGYDGAYANLGNALNQYAYSNTGDATATLKNSGTLGFSADANLVTSGEGGDQSATVYAYLSEAVSQSAVGASASVGLANTGTIQVSANGAFTGTGSASVQVIGSAVYQDAESSVGDASATLTNSAGKTIRVASTASGTGDYVNVMAGADGVYQEAGAYGPDGVESLQFANAGTLDVEAGANATEGSSGYAAAYADGARQTFYNGGAAKFVNGGTVKVAAIAAASVGAHAFADGYSASGNHLDADFSNSGTFNVKASAEGSSFGELTALGATFDASEIAGNIANSGKLIVSAQASGKDSSTADAVGISMYSGAVNTATITNSGTIDVSAITESGSASATAFQAVGFSSGTSAAPALFAIRTLTINNSGGVIVARQSVDGGSTFTHGTAIVTNRAPNPVEINLTGKGSIYGNIDLSADDVINVSGGETAFDGVVNPGGELEGQLNIANGGTLYLANNPIANPSYDGPAKVFVDSLNMASGAKLAIQLPERASGATSGAGIVAQTANIAGAVLEVRPTSANGLYADSVSFNDVIDADELTGKFGSVVVAGGTPLLKLAATYDGGENVDLTLTRVAFGAVAGLTTNEVSVGNGIENVYTPTSTGAFAGLLGTLFTQDAAGYADALEQLSGEQYATYLQSLTGVGSRFNSLLSGAGDCAASTEDRGSCRAEGTGRIWGQANYGRISMDGDVNARGYDADDWYMALGADFNAGADTVLGVAAAYVKHDLNLDRVGSRFGGRVAGDGFQLGAYGAYDPGQFYVKGAVSYTDLKADARRSIVIGTMAGMIKSKPDANIWTLSGEAGYRFELGKVSTVQPYALVEYAAAKLKSFTETGVDAANLDVSGSSHNRASTVLGAKWSGSFGGIVPQLDLGWRHQFGGRTAAIDAAFDIAPGSDFTVISPLDKRDTAMVGVSVSGQLTSSVDVRVGYQGRFNGTAQSNAGGVQVRLKF